jgi:hypothetical protein
MRHTLLLLAAAILAPGFDEIVAVLRPSLMTMRRLPARERFSMEAAEI